MKYCDFLAESFINKAIKRLILLVSLLILAMDASAQGLAINTDGSNPDNSAMLDVKSSSKGFLPPRMTQQQRNDIVNPGNGLLLVCTDCASSWTLCIYNGSRWMSLSLCDTPAPPAGSHVALTTQITWNWNAVTDAAGYKWSTSNNYSTAIDMGSATSKIETGLASGTSFTRYIWAYFSCGTSSATSLNQSTSESH